MLIINLYDLTNGSWEPEVPLQDGEPLSKDIILISHVSNLIALF